MRAYVYVCELFYSKFLTYRGPFVTQVPSVSPARLRDFGRSNKRIKPFRAMYDPQMPMKLTRTRTDPFLSIHNISSYGLFSVSDRC